MGGFSAANADVTPPATDADGYLALQTSTPLVEPAQVHTLLATYWREAKRTGITPSPSAFEPGPWTTDFAQILAVHPQGKIGSNGLTGYYAYQADAAHDPLFSYPEGQGWQIACSAVRVQKTFSAAAPGRNPYQDLDRKNWGSMIAPGAHTAVIVTQVTVPCIEIPRLPRG